MMDYEKAYKDALERARELHGTVAAGRDFLADIFPELRESESEDERIRKHILELVKQSSYCLNPMNQKSMVAWLEKQKEQKPAEWSEEDNIGWDEAFACVTRAEKAAKNEEELQNAATAERWLKEIKFKYNVYPNKQEWSEEDEEMLEYVIGDVNDAKQLYTTQEAKDMADKEIVWLKSLRPRPNTVSIKDATKFGNLEYERGVKDGIQSEKSHQWKPSEEHLSALLAVFNDPNNIGSQTCQLALTDLYEYEQLKKL